jgi:hypothetical protein
VHLSCQLARGDPTRTFSECIENKGVIRTILGSELDVNSDFREKEKTVAIICHMYSEAPPTREEGRPKMNLRQVRLSDLVK